MRILGAVLLCLALAACASKGNWKHEQIDSGSTEFNSSRLSFMLPDSRNHLHLEILRTKNACRGYIYVHSLPISSYRNDPKTAEISIQLEEETFVYLTKRHEGGHRALLSEEILEKILNSLEKGCEVTIHTSGYQTVLSPVGFSSQYKKFQQNSRFSGLL